MARERWMSVLTRFCMMLLLSLGLLLPLFQLLNLMPYAIENGLLLLAGCFFFSLTGINKVTRTAVPVFIAGLLIIFLICGGGSAVIEVVRGLLLQSSGLTTALPLIAGKAAKVATILILLAAAITTSNEAGSVPAALLVVLVLLALWISDGTSALPWMIPAITAVLTMIAAANLDRHNAFTLMPWMAAIAAAACILVPQAGLTVEPLKETADELRSRIYDYLFFTEARDVFSLSNEGYYPQGADQMGGTATPTSQQIMKVETSETVYLRGAIKDTYTGRIWKDTLGNKRYLWISPTRRSSRISIFDEALPAGNASLSTSTIKITMLREGTSSLLVPQRIRSLSVTGDMVPYFNDASEIFITRNLKEEDCYSFTAVLQKAGDAGLEELLRSSEIKADSKVYEQIAEKYTAVPDHVQSQVRELAWNAINGAETPYEKALNLQNWLKGYCTYSLDVANQPTDVDFVSNFLLNTREGYCTYFASAMTILCRLVGLPARYVEGFLAEPDENGVAIITGKQGHAWTEVYFSGYGWLTFDATPGEENGNQQSPQSNQQKETQQNIITPTPEPQSLTSLPTEEPTAVPTDTPNAAKVMNTPAPKDTPKEELQDNDDSASGSSFPWQLLLILLFVVAAAAGICLRLKWTSPDEQAKRAADDDACCEVWLQAVHDVLLVLGKRRQSSESPMAFLQRLCEEGLPSTLSALGALETSLCYGARVPDHEDVSVAYMAWRDLYCQMSRQQRICYRMMRAVVPVKKRKWSA